jgi:hypothetical protein
MQLKHKIKKLELALNINSKFCACAGISYFSIDWKSGDLIIKKTCDKCGKAVEPIDWATMAKAGQKEIEAEELLNPNWKNHTDK